MLVLIVIISTGCMKSVCSETVVRSLNYVFSHQQTYSSIQNKNVMAAVG
jgi:hypothetical protein